MKVKSVKNVRNAFVGSLILLCGVASQTSRAEYPVARTGVFAQTFATPRCDDIFTAAEDLAVEGLDYAKEQAVRQTMAMKDLLSGDPETMLDGLKDLAAQPGDMVNDALKTPMNLMGILADELPDSIVSDVIREGVQRTKGIADDLADSVKIGPDEIIEKFELLQEFGTDVTDVLKNLDDPDGLGQAFSNLQDKWTLSGPLKDIFTAKDPLVGLRKAVTRLQKQVELINIASPVSLGDSAKKVMRRMVLKKAREYIDSVDDPEQKKAMTLYLTLFDEMYAEAEEKLANGETSYSEGRHPFFLAERRLVDYEFMGSSTGSGSDYKFSLLHTKVENEPGCINLGDRIARTTVEMNPNGIFSPPIITPKFDVGSENVPNAVCNVESGRDDWWTRPIDYKLVWGDNCSGGYKDKSVWQPVCPDGFVGVGYVNSGNMYQKPLPNAIACLKADPNLLKVTNGVDAYLGFYANDANSGAKFDATFYQRGFNGMSMMYAIPIIVPAPDPYEVEPEDVVRKTVNIFQPARGTEPVFSKENCVNFYSTRDFGGPTHEKCDLDAPGYQSLKGANNQLDGLGIYSFQCGDGVAAIEIAGPGHPLKIFDCREGGNLGDYENFGFSGRTMSSYIDPTTGETVYSPNLIARNLAVKQKLERARRAEIAIANLIAINNQQYDFCYDGAAAYCYLVGNKYLTGTTGSAPITKSIRTGLDLLREACVIADDWPSGYACPGFRSKAAEICGNDNDAHACFVIAEIYHFGFMGITEDRTRARNTYELACNASPPDGRSCRRYADLVKAGQGGPVSSDDAEVALAHYKEACRVGDAVGCWVAGDEYLAQGDLTAAKDMYDYTCNIGYTPGCDSALGVIDTWQVQYESEETARLLEEATRDTDGDGMPDRWEAFYLLGLNDDTDAAEDANNNGVSNLDEFLRGTDPNRKFVSIVPVLNLLLE